MNQHILVGFTISGVYVVTAMIVIIGFVMYNQTIKHIAKGRENGAYRLNRMKLKELDEGSEPTLYTLCLDLHTKGAIMFAELMGINLNDITVKMLDESVAVDGNIAMAMSENTLYIGNYKITDLDIIHELVHVIQHECGRNMFNWKHTQTLEPKRINNFIVEPAVSVKELEAVCISTAYVIYVGTTHNDAEYKIDLSNVHDIDNLIYEYRGKCMSTNFNTLANLVSHNIAMYNYKNDLDRGGLMSTKMMMCLARYMNGKRL